MSVLLLDSYARSRRKTAPARDRQVGDGPPLGCWWSSTSRGARRRARILAARPGIKLQVLPTSVGAHTGVEGTFTILSAPPELEDYPGCVYVETMVEPYYYEELKKIRAYRNALAELRVKASEPEKAPALFRQLAKDL